MAGLPLLRVRRSFAWVPDPAADIRFGGPPQWVLKVTDILEQMGQRVGHPYPWWKTPCRSIPSRRARPLRRKRTNATLKRSCSLSCLRPLQRRLAPRTDSLSFVIPELTSAQESSSSALAGHAQRLVQARRWVEGYVRRSRYTYKAHLAGLCAISSAQLYQELLYAGFDAQVVIAEKRLDRDRYSVHAFVLCERTVLDVTATQFGKAAHEALPLAQASREWFWRPARTFRDVQKLRQWQLRERFPAEQVIPAGLAAQWHMQEPYSGLRIAA